jgi:hypothetical protein
MRRHFLALEAFDNGSTGAPSDPVTDVSPTPTPAEPVADPAAAASVPPVDTPVSGAPTGAGTAPEPSEPDEPKPVDPAAAPALPAEPGVQPVATDPAPAEPIEPAPVAQAAPTPAEPGAEPVPAVPAEPTNASTAPAPVVDPAAAPTPVADPAAGQPPAGAPADSLPAPTPSTQEADSEAMESLRERLDVALAMEEAAVIMTDCGETAAEINHDLAESERVIQVSDALEDLAFVASTIEKATPAEAALMETAGNMAVAGTDVEPDAIIPAMEGYVGRTIATEGIKETAKNIWEAIVLFVDKIWEKIRAFWRIHGSLPMWRKKIDALRKRASEAGDEAHVKTVKANISLHGLMMGDGVGEDSMPKDIDRDFGEFIKTIHAVFANYANGIVERGHEIVKAIQDFDPNRPEKAVAELKNKLVGMHPEGMKPGETKKLLGNARLELSVYESHPDEPVDEALERLRNSGMKYVSGGVHWAAKATTVSQEMPVVNKSVYVQGLGQCDELLKSLEHFYEKPYHELEGISKQVKQASATATSAIGKAGEAAMAEGKALHHYRSLLNFNKAFAAWTYQPFVPLYAHALRTLRSYLGFIEAGLSAYEGKPGKKEGSQDYKPAGM